MAFAALASALPAISLPRKPEEEEWTEHYDFPTDTYRYHHTQYATGFIVTRELLEDDLYGDLLSEYQKELVLRFRAVV